MAGSSGVDLFYRRYCTAPEFIFAVEDHDLAYTVKCCLDLDSSCGTTCTYDGHFLSDSVDVIVFQCCHKSDTVCDMACKMTMIINDGVYSAAHFCCR